jgi:DNA-binding NarL/FixJ family response regulator
MNDPIRILVCDDHPMFRAGVRAMLWSTPGLTIVGEAGDGESAVEMARRLRPDIVLMDLNMPGCNGVEATRRILESQPQARVLMLSMFDDEEVVAACLEAGACGYLRKDTDLSQLLTAIEAAVRGAIHLSPGVFRRLGRPGGRHRQASKSKTGAPERLPRQEEAG